MEKRLENMKKEVWNKYYKEIGLLSLILIIIFISFRYNDLRYILFYEHSFMNNILDGEKLNFYQYCMREWEKYGFESGACYALWGMPLYVILGIWGSPIYIISQIFDASVYSLLQNIWIVIYGKSVLLLFLFLTILFALKIFDKCKQKNFDKIQMVFLFLSSYFVMAPVFIQGQCDIIEVFFAVLGIYFLVVKKNRPLFLLSFIISVSLKQVSILLFIPIVLIMEKKIWKVILNIGSTLIIPVLGRFIFGGPIHYNENVSNINVLLMNKLPILSGDIPIFLLLYAGICLWAYLYQSEGEEKNVNAILVSGLLVYGGINVFSNQIYRCVWVVPFLMLYLGSIKNENTTKIIALETFAEWCYAFYQICKYPWCFDINNCQYMLLDRLSGPISNESSLVQISSIVPHFIAMHLDIIAGTMMIALVILIVYVLLWKKEKELRIPFLDKWGIKEIIRVRILGIGFIGFVPILLYFANVLLFTK